MRLFFLFAATLLKAQPVVSVDPALAEISNTHRFIQTAISPDGAHLAYVEAMAAPKQSAVYIAPRVRVTGGPGTPGAPWPSVFPAGRPEPGAGRHRQCPGRSPAVLAVVEDGRGDADRDAVADAAGVQVNRRPARGRDLGDLIQSQRLPPLREQPAPARVGCEDLAGQGTAGRGHGPCDHRKIRLPGQDDGQLGGSLLLPA